MLLCSLSPGVRINCVDIWVRNCVDPPRLLTCPVTGARFTQFLTHVLCLRQEQVHSQNGQSRRSPFHNNIPTPRRPPLHLSFLSCRHKNRLVIITHKHTNPTSNDLRDRNGVRQSLRLYFVVEAKKSAKFSRRGRKRYGRQPVGFFPEIFRVSVGPRLIPSGRSITTPSAHIPRQFQRSLRTNTHTKTNILFARIRSTDEHINMEVEDSTLSDL